VWFFVFRKVKAGVGGVGGFGGVVWGGVWGGVGGGGGVKRPQDE